MTPLPLEVYLTFTGILDATNTERITQACHAASRENVTRVHLLLNSPGGIAGHGVFLFNCFRGLPFVLTVYNGGTVDSAAVLAYLGAHERKTSARATFILHRATNTLQSATAEQFESLAVAIRHDDTRFASIVRERARLTAAQWAAIQDGDLCLLGDEAVSAGIADEVREWLPPTGARIYSV